ncbi:unnamed protein product [Cercopithifilaria johnstoni]|uniref:Uncharacterized protein n=1 Tax=Cercopithifilaria johnstoni TaxID=2874296 RepID=A0A8J2Q6X1_9BILA|nr:unnamed protein product [Cercopithifilaria johnstoni]
MIKSWLRWRKAKKVAEDETCGISGKDTQCDYQLNATAAYHTSTRPQPYHGPRSCPADLSINQCNACSVVPDRSLHSDIIIPGGMVHRRRRQQHRFRRLNASTSEYGSGDPSPTTLHNTYNRNLDDSDSCSDSWTAEYERAQHIREMEYRLREQRKKLKDYKGRLRAERDLRIVNERSMMEEVEKYKCELKKEQRERKATEQRYIDIIAYMKTKLSLLEQQQPMGQRCLPPSLPYPGDSIINLQNGTTQIGSAGELPYTLQANAPSSILRKISFKQELDETKNFRAEEIYGDLETMRSSENTATTGTEQSDRNRRSTTLLREYDSDNDDNGYVTTFEYPVKST